MINIKLREIFENTVKNPPNNVKYIFLTDREYFAENLINKRYFSVYLSATPEPNSYTMEEFADFICSPAALYARDYYYLPLCSFRRNTELQELLKSGYFQYSNTAWQSFSKGEDYFKRRVDELLQAADSVINKCEGGTAVSIDDWEQPVPFESVTVPPFPVDCLPTPLKEYVSAVAESTQTPVDMAGVVALATMAVCVQGKYKIQIKPDWIEPLNLYCLPIAESGEKKSVVLREMTQCINQYELEYNESHKEEIAQNRKEREILQRELEDLTSRAAKSNSKNHVGKKDVFEKLKELENFEVKRELRLLSDDSTPEALISLMAENNGMISTISSEGGIFNTLSGRYSASPNIDVFLKAYSGDRIITDRKGRNSEDIQNPCMTVLLTVQPDVVDELMTNTTFRRRGLNARFLYSMPSSLFGNRRYITKSIPKDLRTQYKELCYELLGVKKPESPILIKLSHEASQLSEKLFYELESRLIDDLEPIRDFAAKIHGNIARIAGIIHLIDNYRFIFDEKALVSGETMQAAIDIGYYFLEHAIAAFQFTGANEQRQEAKYLLQRLNKSGQTEISKRDLFNLCKGKFLTVDEMESSLRLLTEMNYIRLNEIKTGGRPSIKILLNPLEQK